MDSQALLAVASDGKRPVVLKKDDESFSVRATALRANVGELLQLQAWLGDDVRYAYLVFDERAFNVASVYGLTNELTRPKVRRALADRGVLLDDTAKEQPLRAEVVERGKRPSVLQEPTTGRWSLRAKVLEDAEDAFVHMRVGLVEFGFIHVVVHHDGSLVALTTGRTDSDAWERM